MARNRPKGNGPHTVIDHPIYEVDFDCKYFGENYSCNKSGGRCDMKWARKSCQFYEGPKPVNKPKKTKTVNKKTTTENTNSAQKFITVTRGGLTTRVPVGTKINQSNTQMTKKKKKNKTPKSINDELITKPKNINKINQGEIVFVYIKVDGLMMRVPKESANEILAQNNKEHKDNKKTNSQTPKIDKNNPNVGKYIISSKYGIGKISKIDSLKYYVNFNDLSPIV